MSRILLTGATGLIGRQVLRQLAAGGQSIHAFSNLREIPADLRALATWHAVDLRDRAAVAHALALARATSLVHVAWPGLTGNLNSTVHQEFLSASLDLVERFYRDGGTRAVIAGTCFEYDWSEGICREDRTPLRPSTVYGACKNSLREGTAALADRHGRSWAWGRIFFVYGPHQEPTRFVPAVIRGLLAREPVPCTEGTQVRDYLHASDVASGLVHLLGSDFCGACNIGSGESTTLRDIAGTIADLVGGHELLQFGARPTPAGEPPVILADLERLDSQLGWRPRFDLAGGLADVVAQVRETIRDSALT